MPTIEENLTRIANALEKIAANSNLGNTSTPVDTSGPDKVAAAKAAAAAEARATKIALDTADAKAAKAAADVAVTPIEDKPKSTKTKDDVRKALQAYREIEGTPAMLEVLKKVGAANLNELAEDKYDEVLAAVS